MSHSIDIREEAGIRYLHFGTDWVQGAMRLSKPNRLVLAYTQAMLAFLLFRAAPRHVLIVGLGAGSLVRFFRQEMPDAHLTVIEINGDVIQVAHQFFKLPDDDERLDVQAGDGYEFMQRASARFDAILVDGYDHRARPGKLESLEFYRACRARLAPQGVLVANVFGRVRGHGQTKRHLREVFGSGTVLLPSADSKNVVVTAFADPPASISTGELRDRAATLRERYGLPFVKWVHALRQGNSPEQQTLFR
jgi:spermidine synthase